MTEKLTIEQEMQKVAARLVGLLLMKKLQQEETLTTPPSFKVVVHNNENYMLDSIIVSRDDQLFDWWKE